MEWDLILNTRELSRDYRFYTCPQYVSTLPQSEGREESLIRRFIRQMEKLSVNVNQEQISLDMWHDTLAFVFDEDAFYLLRYSKTEDRDDRGRVIFVTEGLTCPRENEKIMLLDLPNAVADLLLDYRLLRERYFEEIISEKMYVTQRINWVCDAEHAEDGLSGLKDDLVIQIKRLIHIMSNNRKAFAFVIGPMATIMCKHIEGVVPELPVINVADQLPIIEKTDVERLNTYRLNNYESTIQTRIWYKLQQTDKEFLQYQWKVDDENKDIILTSETYKGTQVRLAEMREQKALIELYLKYQGYKYIE